MDNYAQTLGDRWGGETPPDATNPRAFDYYRAKVTEFQRTLDALDRTYWAVSGALGTGALDATTAAALEAALADYESRRTTLKLTAEAINAGAAAINAIGGRMPSLSIPGILGLPPIVVPATFVAAVGAAVAATIWGSKWIDAATERLRRAQIIETATPEQRRTIVERLTDAEVARSSAGGGLGGGLSALGEGVGTAVKWGAIGFALFLIYRAYSNR